MSEHFSEAELTFSSTAVRLSIDNEPDGEIRAHLAVLMAGLEQIRALLGQPIHVDSGYRCYALNRVVGGAPDSGHMKGYCGDITCRAFGTPLDIVRAIVASDIGFSKCIAEGRWCHIDFTPNGKREVLTAHFGPTGTTYTAGA